MNNAAHSHASRIVPRDWTALVWKGTDHEHYSFMSYHTGETWVEVQENNSHAALLRYEDVVPEVSLGQKNWYCMVVYVETDASPSH